jgi:hypothetical protein
MRIQVSSLGGWDEQASKQASKLKRLYYKGFSLLACLFALGPVMMLTGMEAGS